MSFLFGPVNSRRLGRSLGVDLIPHKTCTFDCLYCEVGATTHLTTERRAYQVEDIIRELTESLPVLEGALDAVTLAGSGEPTLNLGMGEIIAAVKTLTSVPVAVLTNGSLLYQPEVRRGLQRADLVLPSLDTVKEDTFRRLNRPHPNLTLEGHLFGLFALRREFLGQFWLEIMVLKGHNDSEAELALLKEVIARLAPDRVQLNTAVRPVAEKSAQPLSPEELEAVAVFLGGRVEVIASFDRPAQPGVGLGDQEFLAILARRPMTVRHLAQALGLPPQQVEVRLGRLRDRGLIVGDRYQNEVFYRCHPSASGQ